MKFYAEGLREELRAALLVVPRTRGQLEGFENYGDGQKKFLARPQREIVAAQDEDGNDIIIKVNAQPITTLACKTFKKTHLPLPPQAYRHLRLVKLINQAPHTSNDWLNYCYSDIGRTPPKRVIFEVLRLFYGQQTKKLTKDSIQLLRILAVLACQQYRSQVNAQQHLLTQTDIAKMCNKGQKAWEKTWSSRWHMLLHFVETIDKEGLNYVHQRSRRQRAVGRDTHLLMQRRIQFRTRAAMAA